MLCMLSMVRPIFQHKMPQTRIPRDIVHAFFVASFRLRALLGSAGMCFSLWGCGVLTALHEAAATFQP